MKKLLLVVSILFLPIFASAQEKPVVTLLQDLIRADTTNPPGNEILAAEVLQRFFATTPQLETEIISSAPGRANLIARLRGRGKQAPLILLGHLDVVPAVAAEWSTPPFSGIQKGGYLWGRGAIDMKGMVAMEAVALRELAESGKKLAGDLVLVAVADEETGGAQGAEWLLKNYGDRLQAWGVINEGSVGIRKKNFNLIPIQVAEKGVCWLEVTATGQPGHGSMPHAENAVLKVARALQQIGDYPFPVQETSVMKEFTRTVSRSLSFPDSWFMRYLFTPGIGGLMRRLAASTIQQDKALHAMLTHTATPTQLAAGTKINVIPSHATGGIDARILPGMNPERFRDFLQGLVGDTVTLKITMQSEPNESSLQTDLYRTMTSVFQRHFPQAIVTPILSAGASDSRFFRARNIPAYGIIPLLLPESDLAGLHGIDERVPVDQLERGVTILKEIITEALP